MLFISMNNNYCRHCFLPIRQSQKHLYKCNSRILKYGEFYGQRIIDSYTEGLSASDVSQQLNIPINLIYRILSAAKITRSIKEGNQLSKQKRAITMKERYNVEHNFASGSLRSAWEIRLKEEEGINNVFQRESVKNKIKQTLIAKYGVDHPMKVQTFKDKQLKSLQDRYGVNSLSELIQSRYGVNYAFELRRNMKFSQYHRTVVNILTAAHIEHSIEFLIHQDKKYYFDIHITGTNKLIEVNGDFFHANPIIYTESDIIPRINMTAKEKWDMDKQKCNAAKTAGYEVFVVWEFDIKHNINYIAKQLIQYATS